MLLAVQGGLGLANLPDYMVAPESDLVWVLPETSSLPAQCYFVDPEEMRHSKRIVSALMRIRSAFVAYREDKGVRHVEGINLEELGEGVGEAGLHAGP